MDITTYGIRRDMRAKSRYQLLHKSSCVSLAYKRFILRKPVIRLLEGFSDKNSGRGLQHGR
jgi:hypothetical protein